MRAALLIILSVFCVAHLHAQDSVLSRLQQQFHKAERWHGMYKVYSGHKQVGWGLYSLDGKQLIEPRYGDIYRPHRDIFIAHPDYGKPGKQLGIVTDTNGKQLFTFKGSYYGSTTRPVIENFSTDCTEARDEHFNLIFSVDPSTTLSFAENDHLAVFEKSGRLRYYDIRRNMFVHYRVSSLLGGKAALISNPATTRYGIYTDTIVYPMLYKWIEAVNYEFDRYHNPKQFIVVTAFPDDIAIDLRSISYVRPSLLLSNTLDTIFTGDYASITPIWPGLFYVSDREGKFHWLNENGKPYEQLEGYTIPQLFRGQGVSRDSWGERHIKRLLLKNAERIIIIDSSLQIIKDIGDASVVDTEWPFFIFRKGDDTLVLNDQLETIYEGNESVSFPLLLQQEGDYQRYHPFADSLLVLTKNGRARLINKTGKEVFPPSDFIGFEVNYIAGHHYPRYYTGRPYIVATRRKVKRYYDRRYDTARACMLLTMAGKPIHKTVFEDGAVVLDTNFSALYKNAKGKYGISSPDGKILLPFVYDNQFYDEYLKKGNDYFIWEHHNGRYTVRPIAVKYKMKDGRLVAYPEGTPYGSRDFE